MRKMKKVLAVALATVMVFGVSPMVAPEKVADAASEQIADLITDSKAAKHSQGFELTNKGFKVTFSAKMTTAVAWDSPQFAVYNADDSSAENVVTDVANSNCYFVGRCDNYAFDATGNRWELDSNPLANGDSYVYSGTFTRDGVEANSDFTMEGYLVGSSAIITFGNETFSSTSKVDVDTAKTNYVSLIANYCDITNIKYETLDYEATQIGDVDSSAGYGTVLSDPIEVTDKNVYVSCLSTSKSANNWNGTCVFAYNGDKQCVAIRPDCCTNNDPDLETLNGYSREFVASYGGEWKTWNTRKTEGVGTFVQAKVSGTDLIIVFGNNTFGSIVTVKDINPAKGVTLKLTGDVSVASDVYVSKTADYYDISSYRSGSTYTAPTKEGKVFAGWYADAEFTTPIGKDVKTGYAYAKFADEKLLTAKCQTRAGTTAQSESADIRMMLGVDSLNYSNVGFDVTFKGINYNGESETVYRKISVTDNGRTVNYSPATVFETDDAVYMLSCILTNVANADFAKNIEITPYWTTLDGTKVTGTTKTTSVSEALK